jgi:hypothetical protein
MKYLFTVVHRYARPMEERMKRTLSPRCCKMRKATLEPGWIALDIFTAVQVGDYRGTAAGQNAPPCGGRILI